MLKTVRPLLLPLMFGLMTLPAMAGELEQPMKKIGFNYKQAVKAVIEKSAWQRPKLFQWLQSEGNVAESEMHRVFNCGIGMVVIVARENAAEAVRLLNEAGEKALEIGRIESRQDGEAQTIVV